MSDDDKRARMIDKLAMNDKDREITRLRDALVRIQSEMVVARPLLDILNSIEGITNGVLGVSKDDSEMNRMAHEALYPEERDRDCPICGRWRDQQYVTSEGVTYRCRSCDDQIYVDETGEYEDDDP